MALKEHLQKQVKQLSNSYLIESNNVDSTLIELQDFIKELFGVNNLEQHPNYMFISSRDNKNILIDQIRPLKDFIYKTSLISGKKIVVILNADEMNINASNCCLKILEEPTLNTHLFLLTRNSSKLLPTIRSRCVIFNNSLKEKKIDTEFAVRILLNLDKREEFMRIIEANNDLWKKFSIACEELIARFVKHELGIGEIYNNEKELFSKVSINHQSLINKYEKISNIIRDVNEYNLDIKTNSILIIETFLCRDV